MDSSLPCKSIYIIATERDRPFVNRYIVEPLQEHPNKDFRVHINLDSEYADADWNVTLQSKTERLKRCHHVLIIATQNTGENPLVPYTTRLALERAQSCGLLHVGLIIVGRSQGDLQDAFGFVFLRQASVIKVKVNRQFWEQTLMKELMALLTVEYQNSRRIFLSSMAEGLAWGLYLDFLRPAAQEIEVAILNTGAFRASMLNIAIKLFVVISQNGMHSDNLSELHDRIEFTEDVDIEITTSDRKSRKLRFRLYNIQQRDEIFFFVLHVATTINVLNMLEMAPEPLTSVNKEERSFLIKKVVYLLNLLLNHAEGEHLGSKVKLIYLDGDSMEAERNILADTVLKAVVPDSKPYTHDNTFVVNFIHGYNHELVGQPQPRYDNIDGVSFSPRQSIQTIPAYIVICQGTDADSLIARDICKHIANGEMLDLNVVPAEKKTEVVQESLRMCRWCIFILSPTTLLEKQRIFDFLKRKWLTFLHTRIAEADDLRVVVVLSGIEEEHVTLDFRSMICLNKDSPNFLEALRAVLTGGNVTMNKVVSGRNAYQGFALIYVFEYLVVFLEAFENHLLSLSKETPLPLFTKFVILVPGSCLKSELLSRTQSSSTFNIYSRIPIKATDKKVATLEMYRLHFNYRTHLIAIEFPAPVTWLHEMVKMSRVSGLSPDSVYEEAYKFKDLAQRLVDSRPNLANKAKFLYYDDARLTLVEALTEALEDEEFLDDSMLH